MSYKFVFFNNTLKKTKFDCEEYNNICIKDLYKYPDKVYVVSRPLDYTNTFVRFLFELHHSKKINKVFKLPFKSIWYKFYFKRKKIKKISQDELCFIINTHLRLKYLLYLKNKYPKAKYIYLYRDSVEHHREWYPEYTDSFMKSFFTFTMTYDPIEAMKYGIKHFNEYSSIIDIKQLSSDVKASDLLFIGKAKDRLPLLISISEKCKKHNIKCLFLITGVPKEKRVSQFGIEYLDNDITYAKMLAYTIKTRCILEINPQGMVGYTSRFLEAIMYNKKLITNNPYIKKSSFYDERFIELFNKAEDVDFSLIEKQDPNYNYKDEFSPIHLIEQIEKILMDGES